MERNQEVLSKRIGRDITLPNLIGVGAGRAGTTTLFSMLKGAPQIFAPHEKELNFFGIKQQEYDLEGWSLEHYSSLYLDGASAAYRIDVSPVYFFRIASLHEIKRVLQTPKIIITLRDPLERFISQFKHHAAKHGLSWNAYTRAALSNLSSESDTNNEWFSPDKNLTNSLYAFPAEACLRMFGPRNCLFLFYEEIADKWPEQLQTFLGIEPAPACEESRNASLPQEIDYNTADVRALTALFQRDAERFPECIKLRAFSLWPSIKGDAAQPA